MGRKLKSPVKTKTKHEPKVEAASPPSTPFSSPSPSTLNPARQEQQQQQQQRKRQPELDDDSSAVSQQPRPKRRATNAHIIRFLQTRNPNRLEEEDLKRALEASLEEHPDFWPAEDTASCSSSDQSNAPSASSNSSSAGGGCLDKGLANAKINTTTNNANNTTTKRRFKSSMPTKRGSKNSLAMQQNHLFSNICNCQHTQQTSNSNYQTNHPTSNCSASNHCCPMSSVHNRYKPVTKKNIYKESDFFHDGIMEYIEYELIRRGILEREACQVDKLDEL